MTLYPPLAPAAALRWGGIAAAAVAILDQVTKALAHAALFSNPRIIEVTSFNLVPVWNRGVSFGIFADGPEITRWLLTVFALIVSVILGLWMARGAASVGFWLGLIIGGAIGNVIDRVRFQSGDRFRRPARRRLSLAGLQHRRRGDLLRRGHADC